MNLEILKEMREWLALGFYEAIDLPWPRSYGRAMRRLYENMHIAVPPHGHLAPWEPLPHAQNWRSHGHHHALSSICNFYYHQGIEVVPAIAEEKKRAFPQHADFIDRLVADLRPRLPHFGGFTHTNPDIRRVVSEGFDAMEAELDGEIAAVEAQGDDADPAEANLLASLKDYAIGVRALHARTLQTLRRAADAASGDEAARLSLLADAFANAFLRPARTFHEGLIAVHMTWMLDGCDSIGRVDQALGALYEADIASGRLSPDFARRLIDEFYVFFEDYNAWNMQVGGATPEGDDGFNALSREMILACGRLNQRRPNLAFRVRRDTPDEVLLETLDVLAKGAGRPALYNDEAYTETLYGMDLGLSRADSREVGFGGCTETMIPGLSNVGSLEGEVNLARCLELALFDGCDPRTGEQAGPHTGDLRAMPDAEAFGEAVRRQIEWATDAWVARASDNLRRRHTQGDPKMHRTFFTRDCVKRRKSFEAGGARYNWAVVCYQGVGNLIDGLAAVRRCVFEEESVEKGELLDALRADYRGYESLRARLLAAPKFGNDDPSVDVPGAAMIRHAWERLYAHETPRGGRYLPSCIVFVTYGKAGERVGATPDGRGAGQALGDSVGAVAGRDVNGPTALLNSVARLPLSLAVGTPVLNVRFQRGVMATPEGRDAVLSLIRSYFEKGGLQIQISVLDAQAMREAMRKPEEHGDLIVRIGGYSTYFTSLDRTLQESVIERTEHGSG